MNVKFTVDYDLIELVDAIGLNEVRGRPLNPSKIVEKAKELINE